MVLASFMVSRINFAYHLIILVTCPSVHFLTDDLVPMSIASKSKAGRYCVLSIKHLSMATISVGDVPVSNLPIGGKLEEISST